MTRFDPIVIAVGAHMEFDIIVTNIGNAYDPLSHEFICKTTGVYMFSTSLMSQEGAWLSMMHDEQEVSSGSAPSSK